ncbi:MAG: hypothetical protein GY799_19750 [Desulfobulbaceae bacterium]|nr:hypothetical protein [Desulfobulbaceae bacterium]
MAYVAIAMGTMALAGSVLGRRERNQQALADAKALGVRNAGIKFASERRADFLLGEAALIGADRQQNFMLIDKAKAAAESDAKVSAAAAGVDGQSVDAVINDTERTAEEAKRSIDDRIRAEGLQLKANYTDNFLNAAMQKGTSEHRKTSSSVAFLQDALAFGQGFVGAGGLGE